MMKTAKMRAWFGLFVALVFVTGMGAGVLVAPRILPPPAQRFQTTGGPGRSFGGRSTGLGPGRLAPRVAEEIGLDADQQEQLEEVFARRRGRLESIQRDLRRQYQEEQAQLREEIRAILRPEQMDRFEEWLRRTPRRRSGAAAPR